jgi:site-specific recombinase XerD
MNQRSKRNCVFKTSRLGVYKSKNRKFGIDGVINKQRIRRQFRLLEEAMTECHRLEEDACEERVLRTTLSRMQLSEAEEAIKKLPCELSLLDAVNAFLSNYQPNQNRINEVVLKYLQTKEHRSLATYRDVKNKLLRLSAWKDDLLIQRFSESDATAFLDSVPEGSFNHFLRHCRGLFGWAIRIGYIKTNSFASISPRQAKHKEAGVLSVHEAKALLEAAKVLYDGEFLAYVAITLFAGLRPDSEMRKLTWDAINLEDSEIRVTHGKTRIPRTVEIPENLVAWLRICDRSRTIYPKNFRRKWAAIRNRAGFKGGVARTSKEKLHEQGMKSWVKDFARHSAISYRVRQTGDIFTTATWAGNSPGIIRRHYLGLVSASTAEAFWRILPA